MSAFKARYGGQCAADCGHRIVPGDEVVYVDDELVHVECEGAAIGRPPVEVCLSCWLEKPCPCEDGL